MTVYLGEAGFNEARAFPPGKRHDPTVLLMGDQSFNEARAFPPGKSQAVEGVCQRLLASFNEARAFPPGKSSPVRVSVAVRDALQ